jgi:hypothetical protein
MRQLIQRTILALVFVAATTASALVVTPATVQAQVGVHIGVDIPVFPRLVVVPGYPVYYAPDLRANYFFYDGLFWVFNVDDGYWYSSSWYNGPWVVVEPEFVPQPILVVPYRFYHVRPAYWRGWAYDRPPRWDVYWGPSWVERRRGWDHWDRNRRWTAAPLPVFQRDFPRDRYPSPDRQVTIYRERYNYKPRDVIVRERETTIIDRQARGGDRARAKADFIERGPREGQLREQQRDQRQATDRANNQQKEALRQQDRAQRQSNNQRQEDLKQQDRAQRQSNNQRQEDLKQQDRAQRDAADRANRQKQEDLRQQDKARRESNNQAAQRNANNQRQEDLKQQDRAQRQSNVQANRQRQEDVRQQDKARREANVQAERANRQAGNQRQEDLRQQDRAQRQAGAQQDRGRQANVQERGRDRDKGGQEKGDRG